MKNKLTKAKEILKKYKQEHLLYFYDDLSDKEKEKTSYWLKINKNITDLTNGLETYIETTQYKQYANSAKTVLDNSKLIDDDEGR